MNCLLTVTHTVILYTFNTYIYITAVWVFTYNIERWNPAVSLYRIYTFRSFVIVVMAKDSLNYTDCTSVCLNEPDYKLSTSY